MQRLAKLLSFSKTEPHNFRFLVLGAGRGGTSLLSSCLNAHSRLEVAYEYAREELLGYGVTHHDLSKIFEDRTQRFRERCLAAADKSRPKLWGNKITTEQIFGLEDQNALNLPYTDVADKFFADTLCDMPVVFILRDGRACIASKVNRTQQTAILATFRWRYSVQIYRYLRERHSNNITLRFEDLLRAPQKELRRVCDFIGVDFEPLMLKSTQDERMPKEYLHHGFDLAKAKPPDTPPDLLAYLREDLVYCGYL